MRYLISFVLNLAKTLFLSAIWWPEMFPAVNFMHFHHQAGGKSLLKISGERPPISASDVLLFWANASVDYKHTVRGKICQSLGGGVNPKHCGHEISENCLSLITKHHLWMPAELVAVIKTPETYVRSHVFRSLFDSANRRCWNSKILGGDPSLRRTLISLVDKEC